MSVVSGGSRGGGADQGEVCRVRRWRGTHVEIGRMAAGSLVEEWSRRGRAMVAGWRLHGEPGPDVRERAAAVAGLLAKWWPPLLEEMAAVAGELGVWEDYALAAWAPPAIYGRGRSGGGGRSCTVFWVPASMTAGGSGALVGRNFDLRLADPERLFVYTCPEGGEGYGHAGFGGWCGRSEGINDAGLVVAPTEAQVKGGFGDGVTDGRDLLRASLPARLVTRILLERCGTVADAVGVLEELPQWTPFNYLLADRGGDAAVVEVGTRQVAVRRPGWDGRKFLVATNHYCTAELESEADYRWLTRQKYQRVLAGLEEAAAGGAAGGTAAAGGPGRGSVTVEDCQRVLALPGVAQRHLTLWSIVFECGCDRPIHLAPARPDRNEFVRLAGPAGLLAETDLPVTL